MKMTNSGILAVTAVAAAALAVMSACGGADDKTNASAKSSEATVTTNDNGSVSRTFVECNVTTNGSMVTERRRETRTTLDTAGNMLATSTSEYAQSYPVGDVGIVPCAACTGGEDEAAAPANDSFLGLTFGATFEGSDFVSDAEEPTLLRAAFKPKKALAGFDDYYVYVTPKTHKVAKVFACAKDAVEPGARWRRHYLIEALEKRYRTWARRLSWTHPYYRFDVAPGRRVTACLAGASDDYEAVISAWDADVTRLADEERRAIADDARKAAEKNRSKRMQDALDAF